ncbi:hypothetical protein GOODEAATRI_008097 [Goodea atripinnis]|uniref:Uncharacterized protein n=1 Tax=Goodea atripinnis TaxID=208336 RepID=A0ABV0MZL5_9TELE
MQPSASLPSHNLSLLSLTVIIGKALLRSCGFSVFPYQEDQTQGEIVLDLEGGKIFSVAQHQNDPNLNFLTLESKRVELYHRAVVEDTSIPQRLEMPSFTPPKHLDPTIYPTEVGVSSVRGREGEPQMLSTAIKITLDLKNNVKVCPSYAPASCCNFKFSINLKKKCLSLSFIGVLGCSSAARCHYETLHDTDQSELARADYVCVLDIDLLELAITTWKGSDTGKLFSHRTSLGSTA